MINMDSFGALMTVKYEAKEKFSHRPKNQVLLQHRAPGKLFIIRYFSAVLYFPCCHFGQKAFFRLKEEDGGIQLPMRWLSDIFPTDTLPNDTLPNASHLIVTLSRDTS